MLETVEIRVPKMPRNKLIKLACQHFNQWSFGGRQICKKSKKPLLYRIVVNYLRHEMTEYENYLRKLDKIADVDNIYMKIKKRIFEEIAKEYPWLEEECSRQAQQEVF